MTQPILISDVKKRLQPTQHRQGLLKEKPPLLNTFSYIWHCCSIQPIFGPSLPIGPVRSCARPQTLRALCFSRSLGLSTPRRNFKVLFVGETAPSRWVSRRSITRTVLVFGIREFRLSSKLAPSLNYNGELPIKAKISGREKSLKQIRHWEAVTAPRTLLRRGLRPCIILFGDCATMNFHNFQFIVFGFINKQMRLVRLEFRKRFMGDPDFIMPLRGRQIVIYYNREVEWVFTGVARRLLY